MFGGVERPLYFAPDSNDYTLGEDALGAYFFVNSPVTAADIG